MLFLNKFDIFERKIQKVKECHFCATYKELSYNRYALVPITFAHLL
jgi:hypothetical protein